MDLLIIFIVMIFITWLLGKWARAGKDNAWVYLEKELKEAKEKKIIL